MPHITKKGALAVTATLDRVATLFQSEFAVLGIPPRVAKDFALRCDMLSDHIERRAGLNRVALTGDDVFKEPGFNPEEIGEETAGALEIADPAEAFMADEFTQQENRELRELAVSGDLGATVNPAPRAPTPGKQAAALRRQLEAAAIGGMSPRVLKALALAAKVAEEEAKKEEAKQGEEKPEEKGEEKPAAKKAKKAEKPEAVEADDEGDETPAPKKKAKKAEKPEAIEADEVEGDEKEEKAPAKKKAHGFNLFA